MRHRFDPVRQRIGRDPVALPHREVEHDLQLLGRRRREQRAGVLVAELVEHVVELVAGQGADGRVRVAVREQRVRAAQAAAAPELGPERRQGDDVGGAARRSWRSGTIATAGLYSAKLARFDMLSAVLATIAAHELLRAGDRVIVAVSGGPDSMALLHALWELRARLGLDAGGGRRRSRPARRRRAARWSWCASGPRRSGCRSRPCRSTSRRNGGGAAGASLQDAARDARLRALGELARAHGADRVALGHQADDQAETVLYRIIRGTGVAGLAGIPYRRDVFVRPLLDVTRAQILRYLRRRSIPFVEDPSNADPRFARARIRHRILPALAQENPRVAEALRALAAAARGGAAGAPRGRPRDDGARRGAPPRRLRGSPRAAAPPASTSRAAGASRSLMAGSACTTAATAARSGRRRATPRRSSSIGPGTYRWSAAGAVEVRELAVAPRHERVFVARRVRRRSVRLAARHAGAAARGPDAAARRPRRPQAFAPHDRREDRAAPA